MRSAVPTASLDAAVPGDSALGEFVEDAGAFSPEASVLHEDALRHLKLALDSLAERERMVLELRYGIVNSRRHTLREISERLGITGERVRQIERVALERLRRRTGIRRSSAAA